MLEVLPILVISAEAEHRRKILEIIRKCGLKATSCCSLREALALLAQHSFSVLFCNDTLPDGDFHTIMNELRSASADVPLIVLSRFAEWDAYFRAIGAGAFDYIACPPDPVETQRILWTALSESTDFIGRPAQQLELLSTRTGKP